MRMQLDTLTEGKCSLSQLMLAVVSNIWQNT